MSISLVSLLLHEADLPAPARAALRKATEAPAWARRMYLEAAARSLYRDARIDCADARELVGL